MLRQLPHFIRCVIGCRLAKPVAGLSGLALSQCHQSEVITGQGLAVAIQ